MIIIIIIIITIIKPIIIAYSNDIWRKFEKNPAQICSENP